MKKIYHLLIEAENPDEKLEELKRVIDDDCSLYRADITILD